MSTTSTKKVTKKSQGDAIFAGELTNRANGAFDSNKAFRARVLTRMETEIGVSRASAATMFNQAKKAVEASDTNVGLGRDPKKVVAKKATPKAEPVTVTITPPEQEVTA